MKRSPTSRIVLVGGGHSHVQFLKALAMQPLPEAEVFVISREVTAPYSGMLPGRLAGWYTDDEMHFNLNALCVASGATLIEAEAIGINGQARKIVLKDRPSFDFDVASINVGITPDLPPGAAGNPYVHFVKPIARLLSKWPRHEMHREWVVVGSGAAGFELAVLLSLAGARVRLLDRGEKPLRGHGARVQARAQRLLEDHKIQFIGNSAIERVDGQRLILDDGRPIPFERALFATGARAPDWFKTSDLPISKTGFVCVDECLQVENMPGIFAAGDCAEFTSFPLAKAGVFAVRQGPVLADNLRAAVKGLALRRYRPQKKFLSLLTSGNRRAMASYHGFAVEGEWVWKWKDHIDRAFMKRFSLRPMLPMQSMAVNRCGGCGAKLGPIGLREFLKRRNAVADDVGWYAGRAYSVDGFRSFTGDLFFFAQVATWHAMNDLYASAVVPEVATVHVTLPSNRVNDLEQLMGGVDRTLNRAGVQLANAHTAYGSEYELSLHVSGAAERRWSKRNLESGLELILTKRLGTGVLLQARQQGLLSAAAWTSLREHLMLSHAPLMEVIQKRVHAATDISGFGLLGHVSEMLSEATLAVEIDCARVPVLPEARALMQSGVKAFLTPEIVSSVSHIVSGGDQHWLELFSDPQTHGPLLLACHGNEASSLESELHGLGFLHATRIGRVCSSPLPQIRLLV